MFTRVHVLGAVGALTLLSSPALAATETFDNPVTLGATQAPNTWYTDRYAPAGFQSGVMFAGDERLKQSISDAEGEADRPAPYNSAFYNTQGRKFDLAPATTSASIDLYIDASWQNSGRRMAGFWGTGVDGSNVVSAYPIISFNGTTNVFEAWDANLGYVSMGTPGGFSFGQFQTLSFSLDSGNIIYKVGDQSLVVSAFGATSLSNVILQGHNNVPGVSYDIYWDNLSAPAAAGAVPEPTTWALMITGFAAVGASMRRRKTTVAFA